MTTDPFGIWRPIILTAPIIGTFLFANGSFQVRQVQFGTILGMFNPRAASWISQQAKDSDPIGAACAPATSLSAPAPSAAARWPRRHFCRQSTGALAKAIVRCLRLNDDVIPGSAERIVITCTSGGGALSAAVASSGNNADCYPYLAEIGAAGLDAEASLDASPQRQLRSSGSLCVGGEQAHGSWKPLGST